MDWTVMTILIIGSMKFTSCKLIELRGVYELQASDEMNSILVHSVVYNQTEIAVRIDCHSDPNLKLELKIDWLLWYSPCAYTFDKNILKEDITDVGKEVTKDTFVKVPVDPTMSPLPNVFLQQTSSQPIIADCNTEIHLPDESSVADSKSYEYSKEAGSVITSTTQDGNYLLVLRLLPVTDKNGDEKHFTADVRVSMKGPNGYLSAIMWPLLPYYITMYFVYMIFEIIWIILVVCNKRDSLPIQYLLGGVIFIGVLEQAFMFGCCLVVNTTGRSSTGFTILANEMSVLKESLMMIALILISSRIGTVKPFKGRKFICSVVVATIYFIFATFANCLLVFDNIFILVITSLCIVVLTIAIWGWIVASLIRTFRVLRRNEEKVQLTLYKWFTFTLILAHITVFIFFIWTLWEHIIPAISCLRNWKTIWTDEVFSQIVGFVILAFIVLLWRPKTNNQWYAYSSLLNAVEEDESLSADMTNKEELDTSRKQALDTNQVVSKQVQISNEEHSLLMDEDELAPVHDN